MTRAGAEVDVKKQKRAGPLPFMALLALATLALPARAEVIEEIVAWVNGDIITKSDMDQEEQTLLSDVYRRYTGPELDAQLKKARAELLDRMIDRKILVQRASRMYDLNKMQASLVDSFKEQQKIKTDEELQRLLAQDGMTLADLKQRLIEMYAPEEIIRFEVVGRLSISDKEVAAYYDAHPEISEVPAKATVREIVLLTTQENRKRRKEEAEAIRVRATAPGADFEALAREVSEAGTKANGGLLGTVGKGDLAPELEEAAFGVPVGGVSQVIEMSHGFHLIKVDERAEALKKTLDEMREKIRSDLEQQRYAQALDDYLKKARSESDIVVGDKYKARIVPPDAAPPQSAEPPRD